MARYQPLDALAVVGRPLDRPPVPERPPAAPPGESHHSVHRTARGVVRRRHSPRRRRAADTPLARWARAAAVVDVGDSGRALRRHRARRACGVASAWPAELLQWARLAHRHLTSL